MLIDKQTLTERWPHAQYEEIKALGYCHSTYDDYLEMRREQAEISEAARLEGLTGVEFPDELDEEDFAFLDRVWAEIRSERLARESQARELETLAA